MTTRELFLLSLVLVSGLGYGALKVMEKATVVSAEFDLVNGQSTLKNTPEIHVAHSLGNQLLLQLDLTYYQRAKFVIRFQDPPLEGACVNIGDSPTNDGWGGDNGQFSNNAELQIIAPSGGFLVYGSDAMLEADTEGKKSLLLRGEPALVAAKDTLTLEITDGQVAWSNSRGKPGQLQSPHLFALKGQPDQKHGGANDHLIFAAFNRVIANPQTTGKCVTGVKVTLSRQ